MEVDRCLNHNSGLGGNLPTCIHGSCRTSVGRDPVAARQPPLTPKVNRTDVPGDDSYIRRRAPVGDPYDNEKRSDDLFAVTIRRPPLGIAAQSGTNLDLWEAGGEGAPNETTGGPRSNEQQKSNRVKGTRLDKRGNNGPVQSIDSNRSVHGPSEVPVEQEQSCDDHEREENVECDGNRIVWNLVVGY
jgi:hypothetical protein